MSDEIRDLSERVAQAAEAWLDDPADVAAYARLVVAVQARRAHLAARAADRPAPAPDPGDDVPAGPPDEGPEGGADDGAEGPADVAAEVRPVGAGLDGDPRTLLHRLRAGLR